MFGARLGAPRSMTPERGSSPQRFAAVGGAAEREALTHGSAGFLTAAGVGAARFVRRGVLGGRRPKTSGHEPVDAEPDRCPGKHSERSQDDSRYEEAGRHAGREIDESVSLRLIDHSHSNPFLML